MPWVGYNVVVLGPGPGIERGVLQVNVVSVARDHIPGMLRSQVSAILATFTACFVTLLKRSEPSSAACQWTSGCLNSAIFAWSLSHSTIKRSSRYLSASLLLLSASGTNGMLLTLPELSSRYRSAVATSR